MAKTTLSDKEIMAQDERSQRALRTMFVSFFISVAIAILLLWVGEAELIAMWLVNALVAVLVLAWVVIMFFYVKPGIPPPDEAFDEDYLRRTIDRQHRRWRFIVIGLLLYLFVVAAVLTKGIVHADLGEFALVASCVAFAFIALIAATTLSYGPLFFLPGYGRALSDELRRAQQAKTAQFGYILSIVEICALLVAAAYRPQWSVAALPMAVATAIGLPGIYFLILEWRAGRDS